jgi:hypothetical protein
VAGVNYFFRPAVLIVAGQLERMIELSLYAEEKFKSG